MGHKIVYRSWSIARHAARMWDRRFLDARSGCNTEKTPPGRSVWIKMLASPEPNVPRAQAAQGTMENYSESGPCGKTAAKNCSGVGDSGQDGTSLGITTQGCLRFVQMWATGDSV